MTLTEQQQKAMAEMAIKVKGTYASLDIVDVLNRIHLLTNRNYQKCIEGLKMFLSAGLIKPDFVVNLHRLEALSKVTDKAMPLMDSLGMQLVSVNDHEPVHVSDGPTDDEDEQEESKGADAQQLQIVTNFAKSLNESTKPDFSHLNANF